MGLPSLRARTWDQLWIGTVDELVLIPGICSISGPGIKRKLDVKNPKGAAGATIEDEGDELAQLDISILLTQDSQIEAFMAILPDIQPRRKGGPKSPLAISHPLTMALGINAIYIDQVPIFEHSKRAGTLTVKLHAYEWVPRPKPQTTGKGGAGGGGSGGHEGDGVGDLWGRGLAGWGDNLDGSGVEVQKGIAGNTGGKWDDFKNGIGV